jgi:hypothetical protein
LNTRFKQQGQQLQEGAQWRFVKQKRNAYQKALSGFLKQNNQAGVTQDQMNQLSKMLDDIDKTISDLSASNNDQGNGGDNQQGDQNGNQNGNDQGDHHGGHKGGDN